MATSCTARENLTAVLVTNHYSRGLSRRDDWGVSDRRPSAAATVWFLAAVALAVIAAVATAMAGADRHQVLDGFTVSNIVIGLSLSLAGWPIARHRPENRLGWLLLAGGACYTVSGAGDPVLAAATSPGADAFGWRLIATLTNGGWPWAIGLVLPLVLLLFPDGRLPSPRWRWAVAAAGTAAVLFASTAVFPADTSSSELGVQGYLRWPWYDRLHWVEGAAAIIGLAAYVAAVVSLVVRYRRGDEPVRRQILWLLWGSSVMVAVFAVDNVLPNESLLTVYPIVLVPLSVAIAVLRYQLLDIRLVISRTLLYALLTAGVIGAYAGLVAFLDAVVRRQIGLGTSIIATIMIAGVFHPVRVRLQRRIDEVFYGARRDPIRAMTEVGARLGELSSNTPAGFAGVLEGLCRVMRLPSASVVVDGQEVASFGQPPPLRQSIDLRQGGDVVGELTVGLRAGETRLAPADEKVLVLLSTSLAVAIRATSLATQLGRARDALVTTREEERLRLRRDLHDGLGPVLTAVVLQADAARRLVPTDPERAQALMVEIRTLATATTGSIRRLVNELRPAALDALGLVGALQEQAGVLSQRADGSPLHVAVEATEKLADLPPAVEVAAYLIATEALNNVTRHSTASAARVTLSSDGTALSLMIHDNGTGGKEWRPGVGITSMRERAAELGGACSVGTDITGGRVSVTIPLGAS